MRLRHILVLFVAAALALVAVPACTVVDPPAITVGTWSLSRKDFLNEMKTLSENGTFDESGAPKAAGGTTTVPTNYKTSDTSAVLNIYAQSQIMEQELAKRGIKTTPEDQQAFLQAMAQRAAAQGQQTSVDQLQAQLEKLAKPVRMQVDTQIAQQALGRALVPDAEAEAKARADYDTNKEKLAQTCLSAILASASPAAASTSAQRPPTPTEADFNAARDKMAASKAKIDGGATFADVAKSDSDDKQSGAAGGDAGCVSGTDIQSLPPALLEIVNNQPLNQVSDPVKLEGRGYALFKVTSRETPPFDKVKPQLVAQAREELSSTRVDAAVKDAQRSATVTVDPLFGAWDTVKLEVVPPPGADQPATTIARPDTALLPGAAGGAGPQGPATAPTEPPTTAAPSTAPPATGGSNGSAPSGTSGTAAPSTSSTAPAGGASTTSTAPTGASTSTTPAASNTTVAR